MAEAAGRKIAVTRTSSEAWTVPPPSTASDALRATPASALSGASTSACDSEPFPAIKPPDRAVVRVLGDSIDNDVTRTFLADSTFPRSAADVAVCESASANEVPTPTPPPAIPVATAVGNA